MATQFTDIEHLTGSAFADTLTGGDANNRLDGGAGDDMLTGGAGADTFIFNIADGPVGDTIADFEDGTDSVQISGATFGDLDIADSGGDAVVTWAGVDNENNQVTDTLTFTSLDNTLLTADDFLIPTIFVRCPIGTDKHRAPGRARWALRDCYPKSLAHRTIFYVRYVRIVI